MQREDLKLPACAFKQPESYLALQPYNLIVTWLGNRTVWQLIEQLDGLKVTCRIAGNIGWELNLVDWQFWKQTAKLESVYIWSINCVVHVNSASISAQK